MLFMCYISLSIIVFLWSKVPYRNTLLYVLISDFRQSDLAIYLMRCVRAQTRCAHAILERGAGAASNFLAVINFS